MPAPKDVHIQAAGSAIQAFRDALATDPSVKQKLIQDPAATLQNFGITVDPNTAQSIKTQLTQANPAIVAGVISVTAVT